ncbi:MAG TPA: helix-turn-helix domain-containing protein [Candidatus Agathobaculum pullistercoris]|nr:helix-turn-helix transcriptional regulator [uncultured Agathobaculum sp.]HIX11861.1 helix-turn-helix domain-containing protein [Candidatus Agathobaculum pullistercoris]
MTLGEVISNYRKTHGLSMDKFAELSRLSKAYISILERNRTPRGSAPSPSIDTYRSIAKAIDIDVDELIRLVDNHILSKSNIEPNHSNPTRLIDKYKRCKPDFKAELKNIFIDTWTYGTLVLLARQNNRSLQEEIEDRLYRSVENEIDDIISAEDNVSMYDKSHQETDEKSENRQ